MEHVKVDWDVVLRPAFFEYGIVSFLTLVGIARTSFEPPKVDRPDSLEDKIFALRLSQPQVSEGLVDAVLAHIGLDLATQLVDHASLKVLSHVLHGVVHLSHVKAQFQAAWDNQHVFLSFRTLTYRVSCFYGGGFVRDCVVLTLGLHTKGYPLVYSRIK
jgi:hypothetical protein